MRQKLENESPELKDFIAEENNVDWSNYSGKLKREKGENERLRLPPWLKTVIPTGEFAVIKYIPSQYKYNIFIRL